MSHINKYKPRYFFRNRSRSKVYIYKDGYIRRFYERRGRRAKRGGLFRGYVLVANNRKWTIARRFMRPVRRRAGLRIKRSRSTVQGKPSKRFYKNSLVHKQRLRHFYGKRKEATLRSYFNTYRTLQGTSSQSFFSSLESRLDRTLYRRRLFPTLYGCRQFVNYHGVFVNQVPEHSTRYAIKVGDTISIPDFAWRSLYWDLFCRVYYRRWGRFMNSRRFYSRFQKKVFKRRWYSFKNLPKNHEHASFRKSKKTKNAFKTLWYNLGAPSNFSKYFQRFGKPSASKVFRPATEKNRDKRRIFTHLQRPSTRRGFFIRRTFRKKRPSKVVEKDFFKTTLLANKYLHEQTGSSFAKVKRNTLKKKKVGAYKKLSSPYLNKMNRRVAKNNRKSRRKPSKGATKSSLPKSNLSNAYARIGSRATRMGMRVHGRRLSRRFLSDKLESHQSGRLNSRFPLDISKPASRPEYWEKNSSRLQLLFDQRGTYRTLEWQNSDERVSSRFDFYKKDFTLLQRKRAKLASYFSTKKIRKQLFPFFDNNLTSAPVEKREGPIFVDNAKSINLVAIKKLKARSDRFRYNIQTRYRTGRLKARRAKKGKVKGKTRSSVNILSRSKKSKVNAKSPFGGVKHNLLQQGVGGGKNTLSIISKSKRKRQPSFSWKSKKVRWFHRKFTRFFRRRRYRIRRRRRYPRIKSTHRYFPSYLQRDLRTLRSVKINNPTTDEIFSGFRLSAAKIYSYYKSRAF